MKATKHLAERLVLSGDASASDSDEAEVTATEATAEAADRRLDGLHAKVYIADAGADEPGSGPVPPMQPTRRSTATSNSSSSS
jgi:hypothetical protein